MNINNRSIKIASLVMSFVTFLTMAGCKANKNSDKYDESTLIPSSISDNYDDESLNNEITDNNLFSNETTVSNKETTTKASKKVNSNVMDSNSKINSDYSLNDLLGMLEKNISKYPDETKTYLRDLIKKSYVNSLEMNKILISCGFPGNGTFIKEKLIDSFKNINDFRIYKRNSNKDYDKMLQEKTTCCYDPESKSVYIFYDEISKGDVDKVFLEEITHAGQNDDNLYDYALYTLLKEGEANFVSGVCGYDKIINSYYECFHDDTEKLDKYNVSFGLGYSSHSLASKYYFYLLTLTDYKTMENLQKTNNTSQIEKELNKLYGIDSASLINKMNVNILRSTDHDTFGTSQDTKNIEKTYMDCLSKKVDLINSKEDTIQMVDLLRYVNLQFGYVFFVDNIELDKSFNKTNDITNYKTVVEKLYNNCIKYNLFNISQDKTVNKKAFYALVCPEIDSEQYILYKSVTDKNIYLNDNNLIVSNGKDSYYTNIDTLSYGKVEGYSKSR